VGFSPLAGMFAPDTREELARGVAALRDRCAPVLRRALRPDGSVTTGCGAVAGARRPN
jgi:hypothetical protein